MLNADVQNHAPAIRIRRDQRVQTVDAQNLVLVITTRNRRPHDPTPATALPARSARRGLVREARGGYMSAFTEPRSGVGVGNPVPAQRTERTTNAELLMKAARGLQAAADALRQIADRMVRDGK